MPSRPAATRRTFLACLALTALVWFGVGPFLAGHGHEGPQRHTCNLCRSGSLPTSGALQRVELPAPAVAQSERELETLAPAVEPVEGTSAPRAPPFA